MHGKNKLCTGIRAAAKDDEWGDKMGDKWVEKMGDKWVEKMGLLANNECEIMRENITIIRECTYHLARRGV